MSKTDSVAKRAALAFGLAVVATIFLLFPPRARAAKINEVNLFSTSGTSPCYFEILKAESESLEGLTYIVIGGYGNISSVVPLSGIPFEDEDRYVVVSEGIDDEFPNVDYVTDAVGFGEYASQTHLLVRGFSGTYYQDLDTDDDGALDVFPWSSIEDGFGYVSEEYGLNCYYTTSTITGTWELIFCFRMPDGIGDFSLAHMETPGEPNTLDAPNDILLSGNSVDENSPAGTVVGTLSTTEYTTSPTHSYIYSIATIEGNPPGEDCPFEIVGNELRVTSSTLVDCSLWGDECTVGIKATDEDDANRFLVKERSVSINDVNEPPPDILIHPGKILDDPANDAYVGTLYAFDEEGQDVLFSFVEPAGDAGGRFKIVGDTIQVANGSLIDYETATSHAITLRATECETSPALTFDKTLTIYVVKPNGDPTDVLLSPDSVDEKSPPYTVVGHLSASDPDPNQRFSYSLVAPYYGANGRFYVWGDDLIVNSPQAIPEYETASSYQVTIKVTDDGLPSALSYTKSLTVHVNDVNNPPSNIALSAMSVLEHSTTGTVVGNLTTTDIDTVQTHVYSFVAPYGDAEGRFKIEGAQVQVANGDLLDRDTATSHSITIRSTDSGSPPLSLDGTFNIKVMEPNNAPTDISLSTNTIDEYPSASHGTVIGTLTITDSDPGQDYAYSLVAPYGDAGGRFQIVGNQIQVNNASLIDYEGATSHQLTVCATDDGVPPLSCEKTFSILVNDVNDVPIIDNLNFSLAENSPNGTVAGILSLTDPDVGQNHSYSFVLPYYDATGRFSVVGNELRVANSGLLNYEQAQIHHVDVVATDDGTPPRTSSKQTIGISVTNVNETPDFTIGGTSVNENAPTNTVVGYIYGSDPEAWQTLYYSFVEPYGDSNGRFKLAYGFYPHDPRISVANGSLIDYETSSSLQITVRVRDSGTPMCYRDKTLTITVNNVNDKPSNISLSNSTVSENAANDTVVGDLSTTDQDPGQTHTYAFVAPNNDAGARFKIVGNQIQVANGSLLDYDTVASHPITVRATDNGSPPQFLDKTFTIALENVNETPTDISLSGGAVNENASTDTVVGALSTTDPDTTQTHTYSFVDPNNDAGGRFKIVGDQIQVANGSLLDYEAATTHVVTVRTTDNGSPELFFEETLILTVNDVNETPTDISLTGDDVDENAANDTLVGALSTTDPDTTQAHTYSFVAPNSDAGGRFKIVGNEIQVANGSLLDYEDATTHAVTVRTTDNGSPAEYYDESSVITVNDVNDAPSNVALSASTVDENAANDTVVGDLSTTDQDAGQTHVYEFVAPNNDAGGRFKIVGNQIQVANGTLLDYEANTNHQVTVRTTDNGSPELFYEETLILTVNDVNETATDISLAGDDVDENAANDTVVGALSTTDPDTTQAHTYSFVAPDSDAGGRFKIVGNEIQVANGALLDFEAATSHAVTVRSTDDGSPAMYREESFVITVNDMNDAPTDISLSGSDVDENAANDTVVGDLSTTDPDTTQAHTYSFVAPDNDAGGRFKIVGSQIQIANGSLLNYEADTSHQVTVRTTDNGSPALSYDKTFTITVNNVNETPTDIALSSNSIHENAVTDATVGTLSTTDPDSGQSFTYSFVGPDGDAGGRFKTVGNQIQVANGSLLDYETSTTHLVTVRTTDNGSPAEHYDKSFTIQVNDLNEAPTDVALSPSAVAENAANNTLVGSLSATDPDAGNSHAFSFVAPEFDAGGRFTIVGSQIRVADGSLLDYESAASHQVTVRATDNGTPAQSFDKTLTISLTDANEAPSDIELSENSVNENAANDTVVGTLSTADPDTTQTHAYTFVGPNSDAGGRFKIVGDEIQVADGALLDYEAAQSHLVTVRTTDDGSPALFFDKTFTITVNNVNETPTDIDLSGNTVSENAANDTVVGALSTTDPDTGQGFTYSFVDPNNDAGGRFKIVGSEIQVANGSLLDYEDATTHAVTVRATDNGSPELFCEETFVIAVNNVNETPTDISLSGDDVDENAANDTVVGALSTTDPDTGQDFTYSFVDPNNDAGGRFKIVGSEIQVANGSLLDYEDATTHAVTVRATDNGSPELFYEETFVLTVNDVNETPTDISLSGDAVDENAPNDTPVGTLSTTDPDTGQDFTYSFVDPNNDAGGRFKIVGDEIQVANGALLDYEAATSHQITVRATDNGSPELFCEETFVIAVNNVNETPTDISLAGDDVDENAPNDTPVGTLSTTDPDTGQGFTYSFVDPNNDAGGRFKIVGDEIQVANGALLDYEAATTHAVTVRTTDNGSPAEHCDKSFAIQVNDLNEAPTDVALSPSTVAENAANDTLVGSLSATDPDAGSSHTFSFVAPEFDAGGRFAIVGGEIRVANGALLDYEAAQSHAVTVRATDSGFPAAHFDKDLTISVTNVNEAPTDMNLSGTEVDENAANDTLIGTLSTSDPDTGQTFTYSFIAPDLDAGGRFKIVGDEIQVANGALLDYEAATSHPVTVRATDNGSPALSCDRSFAVAVNDVNEAPESISLSAATVGEKVAAGTLIGTLSCVDCDLGQTHVYSFVGPNGDAGGRFSIAGCELRVANPALLDYAAAHEHAITIRATDSGAGNLTCTRDFTISINEPPPIEQSQSQSVPAGAGEVEFAQVGVSIAFQSNSTPGTLTADRIAGSPPGLVGALDGYWRIWGLWDSEFLAILTFDYDEDDLRAQGFSEDNLALVRSSDGGRTWIAVPSVTDPDANTISTASPQSQMFLWAIVRASLDAKTWVLY